MGAVVYAIIFAIVIALAVGSVLLATRPKEPTGLIVVIIGAVGIVVLVIQFIREATNPLEEVYWRK